MMLHAIIVAVNGKTCLDFSGRTDSGAALSDGGIVGFTVVGAVEGC